MTACNECFIEGLQIASLHKKSERATMLFEAGMGFKLVWAWRYYDRAVRLEHVVQVVIRCEVSTRGAGARTMQIALQTYMFYSNVPVMKEGIGSRQEEYVLQS